MTAERGEPEAARFSFVALDTPIGLEYYNPMELTSFLGSIVFMVVGLVFWMMGRDERIRAAKLRDEALKHLQSSRVMEETASQIVRSRVKKK